MCVVILATSLVFDNLTSAVAHDDWDLDDKPGGDRLQCSRLSLMEADIVSCLPCPAREGYVEIRLRTQRGEWSRCLPTVGARCVPRRALQVWIVFGAHGPRIYAVTRWRREPRRVDAASAIRLVSRGARVLVDLRYLPTRSHRSRPRGSRPKLTVVPGGAGSTREGDPATGTKHPG